MTYTDNNPNAPQMSAPAWTFLRLVAAASFGSASATTKHVIE